MSIEIGVEKIENPELIAFHESMERWIAKQQKRKQRNVWDYEPESDIINPNYLNETDLRVWKKLLSGEITDKDTVEYRKRLQEELVQASPEITRTRESFQQFIANKSAFIIANKSRVGRGLEPVKSAGFEPESA